MRKFEAELYLRLAEHHRVDNLFGAPTMFQMLATSDVVEQYDLSSVRIAMCGGAPLDRKSTRLNSSHPSISYAVFCLKKKNKKCEMYKSTLFFESLSLSTMNFWLRTGLGI